MEKLEKYGGSDWIRTNEAQGKGFTVLRRFPHLQHVHGGGGENRTHLILDYETSEFSQNSTPLYPLARKCPKDRSLQNVVHDTCFDSRT